MSDAQILDRLETRFPSSIERVAALDSQPTAVIPKELALLVFEHIRSEEGYQLFLDVAAVDWFPAHPRFELVYHFYQPEKRGRLRLKVLVDENEPMPSIVGLWEGATWPEREAYDLFGILFSGHPDLRRIYLPDDWEGHPLRKDYPTRGNRID